MLDDLQGLGSVEGESSEENIVLQISAFYQGTCRMGQMFSEPTECNEIRVSDAQHHTQETQSLWNIIISDASKKEASSSPSIPKPRWIWSLKQPWTTAPISGQDWSSRQMVSGKSWTMWTGGDTKGAKFHNKGRQRFSLRNIPTYIYSERKKSSHQKTWLNIYFCYIVY